MKTIGICGGNGVILHPFKQNLIANIEPRSIFHTKGDKQWCANFSSPIYKDRIPESLYRENIDLLIGAPDCGHSSILALSRAKTYGVAKDNKSLTLYLKSVLDFNPKIWVMENLPKLLSQISKKAFRKRYKNYRLIFHEVSVEAFGNSQVNRKRLLIIGIRKDIKYPELYKGLSNTYKVNKIRPSGKLIEDLPNYDIELGQVRENINDVITLYSRYKATLKEIRKWWIDNPDESRWIVENRNFKNAPGVYRNLYNRYPNTARKANRQFKHNGLTMSPRELARIQGVPDSFKIYVEEDKLYYWINKGRATVTKTPPYEIGLWLLDVLNEHNTKIIQL